MAFYESEMYYNDNSLGLNCTKGPSFILVKVSLSWNSVLRCLPYSFVSGFPSPNVLPGANRISYMNIVMANVSISSLYAIPLPIQPLGPTLKGQKALCATLTVSLVTFCPCGKTDPGIQRSGRKAWAEGKYASLC